MVQSKSLFNALVAVTLAAGCGMPATGSAGRLQGGSTEARSYAKVAAAEIARQTGANPEQMADLIESQQAELTDLARLRRALPMPAGGTVTDTGQAPRLLTLPPSLAPTTNVVDVLIDADRIFPAIEDAIRKAQRRVQLDLFMLGGLVGSRIAQALEDRRRAGVDVRIVLDSHFAAMGPANQQAMATSVFLRDHGMPVRTFPLDTLARPKGALGAASLIDHNKIVVADDVAFIGCANLIDVAGTNHDLMFRVRGPIAAEISHWVDVTFDASEQPKIWQTQKDQAPRDLPAPAWRPGTAVPRGPTARARLTRTDRTEHSTYDIMLARIETARRIDFGVFEMDDAPLTAALVAAKGRGARLRILLDRHQMDAKYTGKKAPAGIPNWLAVRDLLGAGIPVKWFDPSRPNEEMHLKMALFDGQVAVVGSTNFTTRAFLNYRETGLELEGGQVVADLVAMFERDWAERSTAVTTLTAPQRALAATIGFLNKMAIGWW